MIATLALLTLVATHGVDFTFHGTPDSSVLNARNDAQHLAIVVDPEHLAIDSEKGQLRLHLSGLGRVPHLDAIEPATSLVPGSRAEIRRPKLVEWYANDERGLEQGFTITKSVAGEGPLVIALDCSGDLIPALAEKDRVVFQGSGGTTVLEYAGLAAWSADHVPLGCRFAVEGSVIQIQVEDAQASYPITIDPVVSNPTW